MQALRKIAQQHLGPIRRRDEKIAEQQQRLKRTRRRVTRLRQRLRDLEKELDDMRTQDAARSESRRVEQIQNRERSTKPSFQREILSLRTQVRNTRSVDPESRTAIRQLPHKLRNYRLAQSHNIRTPEILEIWPSVDAVSFDGLPDQFVLKSDGGAGGQGVYPLTRTSANRFIIAGTSSELREADILDKIRSMRQRARPPFFAESFLKSKVQEGPLPQDVKIYAFYGELGQILLRSVDQHGSHDAIRYRFIWPDGSDLGQVSFDMKAPEIDATVPIPADLDDMLEDARHLSMCVGTPFVRVDVYDTPGAPTLGELTRAPGGEHNYEVQHDEVMGAMWLRAQMRLEYDLMSGRPPGAIHGEYPNVDYYGSIGSTESGPGSWNITSRPCSQWCRRTIESDTGQSS